MCEPRLRWMPEHSMHMRMPRFRLAHSGSAKGNQNQKNMLVKHSFKYIYIYILDLLHISNQSNTVLTGRIAVDAKSVARHTTADRLHRGHLARRQLLHLGRFVGLQRLEDLLLDHRHPFVAFVRRGRLKVPLFVVERHNVEFKGVRVCAKNILILFRQTSV